MPHTHTHTGQCDLKQDDTVPHVPVLGKHFLGVQLTVVIPYDEVAALLAAGLKQIQTVVPDHRMHALKMFFKGTLLRYPLPASSSCNGGKWNRGLRERKRNCLGVRRGWNRFFDNRRM